MNPNVLDRSSVLTLLKSLLSAELSALRHLPAAHWVTEQWHDSLIIGEKARESVEQRENDSLEADSLELMALATRVNVFFQMHLSGIEDYLLRQRTLGDWANLVLEAQRRGSQSIGFQTSGSTGEPRVVVHGLAALQEEVATLAPILAASQGQPARRLLALTPPHHIYGFLFTVLLSEHLNIEVIRSEKALAALLGGRVKRGDLIVGIPAIWAQAARQGLTFPAGVLGLSSTAPADPAVLKKLCDDGLEAVLELYGSSETAGIGWRKDPDQPFNLLARWARDPEHEGQLQDRDTGDHFELSDHVQWVSERQLVPLGRRDNAIQVGGSNVYPQQVRAHLESLPEVSAASVRLMRPDEGQRLKAFIVPADPTIEGAELHARLENWCRHNLTPSERPKAFRFGSALPRNAMNKLSDWDADPAAAAPQPLPRTAS